MRRFLIVASMMGLILWANVTVAEPVAYPTKGRSFDQQNRDEYECHEWAQKEAGAAENADLRAQLDKYDRTYSACLTGRGYSVK